MEAMDYRVPCRIGWWCCILCDATAEMLSRGFSGVGSGFSDVNDTPCSCGAPRTGNSVGCSSPKEARRVAQLHRDCWGLMDRVRKDFWREHGRRLTAAAA